MLTGSHHSRWRSPGGQIALAARPRHRVHPLIEAHGSRDTIKKSHSYPSHAESKLSWNELLQARHGEHEALLHRAVALLQADTRVVAAWLFGSRGRDTADALSDTDLWVVVTDADSATVMRRITTTTIAGRISGSVICTKRRQALARSMRAAS